MIGQEYPSREQKLMRFAGRYNRFRQTYEVSLFQQTSSPPQIAGHEEVAV
jgi:hypothetical protein